MEGVVPGAVEFPLSISLLLSHPPLLLERVGFIGTQAVCWFRRWGVFDCR